MRAVVIALALVLGGCSITPTYEKGTLTWVGCHIVDENPSEGSTGYMLFSKLDKGDTLLFQQVDDNGDAIVTIGEPCR